MILVLVHNAENGQLQMHIEGGPPDLALQLLATAHQMITQQLAGPKLFLPHGQTHVAPPNNQPPPQPES